MSIVKKAAVGLGLLGALCSVQAASNWTLVFDDINHSVYVDPSRIKSDGDGHVLIWVMSDFTKHPLFDQGSGMTARTMIERDSIDCRLDRYKALSAQLYDPQGNNLGGPDLSAEHYRDIPPDSAVEAVERVACRK